MFKITGTNISMTRGDSASFDITVQNADGTPYTLHTGDTVTLTVKKTVNDSEVLLQKQGVNITLENSDTKNLEYGSYVYDVQVDLADGSKHTIIEPSVFEIRAEVNWL